MTALTWFQDFRHAAVEVGEGAGALAFVVLLVAVGVRIRDKIDGR